MKSALHPSYTCETKCCARCRHVVFIPEYDSAPDLYCGKDAPERPPSGSVALGEAFPTTMRAWKEAEKRWVEWAKPRYVAAHGACEQFEERKP